MSPPEKNTKLAVAGLRDRLKQIRDGIAFRGTETDRMRERIQAMHELSIAAHEEIASIICVLLELGEEP